VYGCRTRRDDGWRRVIASGILKVTLLLCGGVLCPDANVPYRLMRTSILPHTLDQVPKDFFLANVALAVLLRRRRDVRHASVPIHFRERYGGEPSVRLGKFGEKALELIRQIRKLGTPSAENGQECAHISHVAPVADQRTAVAEANSSQIVIKTT
jgi:hypothetical protein